MKKILLLLLGVMLSLAFTSPVKSVRQSNSEAYFVNDPVSGKTLVRKKACTLCHDPSKDVVGPSFNAIALKYEGNSEKILEFLEGKRDPIVKPEDFKYMKPVLEQLAKMSDKERKAIAKYISYFTISN